MVKNKKALTLLLVFLAFFNSPAYPKGKSIKYLPSSQDVETVSKDYSSSPLVVSELGCSVTLAGRSCANWLDLEKECNDCVDLKTECPDCCLTDASPKAIKCSPSDTMDDYDCGMSPFKFSTCTQVGCDYTTSDDDCSNCGSRYLDDELTNSCENEDFSTVTQENYLSCNTDGTVVSSSSPYGLKRRGCPDRQSDELKPNCASCVEIGTDVDGYRIWSCPASCGPNLSPSFQACNETSGPPRCDGLPSSSYYDVRYVWEDNPKSCTWSGCSNCSLSGDCPISSPSAVCNGSVANPTVCAARTCSRTGSCDWCQFKPCPPIVSGGGGSTSASSVFDFLCPSAYATSCSGCDILRTCSSARVACSITPRIREYIYRIRPDFKTCINRCTLNADDYEECQDRVKCCRRAVCETGYGDNCSYSSCNERLAASPGCYNATSGDCTGFNQSAQDCLKLSAGSCFQEIDSDNRYELVARTGEAYNVIWQINTEPLNEAKNDQNAKFYTMIKVVEPLSRTAVYSSMWHQKSLSAAFSIYGRTLIPKGILWPGKNYQIQVHYFMSDYADTEPDDYNVEIKHMSLTVIRVRE